MQAHKARDDLLRWKLVIIAVLGATGLGLQRQPKSPLVPLVLCAIPLACAYVDLLCVQLWLRMEVVGTYLQKKGKAEAAKNKIITYEEFVLEARNMRKAPDKAPDKKGIDVFRLEHWALFGSTIILSIIVIVFGWLQKSDRMYYYASGILGSVMSVGTFWAYYIRNKALRHVPVKREE
jgi:hypothetical protein